MKFQELKAVLSRDYQHKQFFYELFAPCCFPIGRITQEIRGYFVLELGRLPHKRMKLPLVDFEELIEEACVKLVEGNLLVKKNAKVVIQEDIKGEMSATIYHLDSLLAVVFTNKQGEFVMRMFDLDGCPTEFLVESFSFLLEAIRKEARCI